MYQNNFLYELLSFIEKTNIEGKDGGFESFLNKKGIPSSGEYHDVDKSIIDWHLVKNHYQFFYDYIGSEEEIKIWLLKSDLIEYEYLYTYLVHGDPIIKIKTIDFINDWEEFNIAAGWNGLILLTENAELFLEFTDDWKHHLNTNFQICP